MVFSAVQIQKTIKDADLVNPDSKLVIIHSVNFCINSLLWASESVLQQENDGTNIKRKFFLSINRILLNVFEIYMNLFILYLLAKFSKAN